MGYLFSERRQYVGVGGRVTQEKDKNFHSVKNSDIYEWPFTELSPEFATCSDR